jgi:gamma-glutamyltranspeptidase/glutathione hydrolase
MARTITLLVLILFVGPALARPIHENRAMVTSAQQDATNAGVEILKAGGNAVDAAIATTLALSVTVPFSAGIGGGGFALVYLNDKKKMLALDFRERAPALATSNMYGPGKSSVDGHLAVAVPGTVAGLVEAHKQHGKLPWVRLFGPAIKLARDGFMVDSTFVERFKEREAELKKHEASWKVFTNSGRPFAEGETLKQPDLARTLETLSRRPEDFYSGSLAKGLVGEMKSHGGIISEADLKAYKPKWMEPLCGTFMSTEICSMPPPSSGGVVLLEMLNGIEAIGSDKLPWRTPETVNQIAKVMKFAYKDRAKYLGDPAFVKMPIDKLISKDYAGQKVKESEETTHLNVVDKDHNAVSLTFTVNLLFGSGVVVPKTGILLNNEMDDFSSAPGVPNAFGLVGGEANSIQPSKTPLSSMTPVIALKDGKLSFAVGAPGGSRIPSAVFLTILNHMIYGMNVDDAISSGRFHHQWMPDEIEVEEHSLEPATIEALRKMGNKVNVQRPWVNANMIVVSPTGGLDGAVDRRGVGTVGGY